MKKHFPKLFKLLDKFQKPSTVPKIELIAVPFKDRFGDILWEVNGVYNEVTYKHVSYSKQEALRVIRRRIKGEIKADKILSTREQSTHQL